MKVFTGKGVDGSVRDEFVGRVEVGSDGRFIIGLPPGRYVIEGFVSAFGEPVPFSAIRPIRVEEGTFAQVRIEVVPSLP